MVDFQLEELTHDNLPLVRMFDRSDVPEAYVGSVDEIMEVTDYGVEHHCIGHAFAVKADGKYIGLLLLGEALEWDTDPPEMRATPFYRLMGFAIDRNYRNMGIRPIALGCHKDNRSAERFYLRHGFRKTEYREGEDFYFIRYPQ